MKKLSILFSVLFAFQTAFGQWNAIGWNPYFVRSTEGDSTFVLSSPSRYDLQRGIANWTPASGASYKVYTALLTQTGTDAPVATVLENTTGETIVWTRDNTGTYLSTCSSCFPQAKTFVFCPTPQFTNGDYPDLVRAIRTSSSEIQVNTYANGDYTTVSDGLLLYCPIEIRIYP